MLTDEDMLRATDVALRRVERAMEEHPGEESLRLTYASLQKRRAKALKQYSATGQVLMTLANNDLMRVDDKARAALAETTDTAKNTNPPEDTDEVMKACREIDALTQRYGFAGFFAVLFMDVEGGEGDVGAFTSYSTEGMSAAIPRPLALEAIEDAVKLAVQAAPPQGSTH